MPPSDRNRYQRLEHWRLHEATLARCAYRRVEGRRSSGSAIVARLLLVRVAASLVSAGTERASAEFAGKNLVAKAKARPTWCAMFSARFGETDWPRRCRLCARGSISPSRSVTAARELCLPLEMESRTSALAIASPAPALDLPCMLRLPACRACWLTKIPNADDAESVSYEEAAFGTVGAICLHGIRTAEVALGDTVALIGLGLLGQITVQLLKAAGCRVFGLDLMRQRADLGLESGAEAVCSSARDFRDLCFQKTGGMGVDSVLVTAETASSEPVNLAAELARDRAIVVAVGTIGMDLQRKLYYEKELDFRISRSYGPGRYDTAYEQKGRDYPIGHVRWTETRNMEAFLQFVADGKLNLTRLITHRFPVEEATRSYDLITGGTREPFLGVLITYADPRSASAVDLPGEDSSCIGRPFSRFNRPGRAWRREFCADYFVTRAPGDFRSRFRWSVQCDRAA